MRFYVICKIKISAVTCWKSWKQKCRDYMKMVKTQRWKHEDDCADYQFYRNAWHATQQCQLADRQKVEQQPAVSNVLATAAAAASCTVRFLAIDWQNPTDTHTPASTSHTHQKQCQSLPFHSVSPAKLQDCKTSNYFSQDVFLPGYAYI